MASKLKPDAILSTMAGAGSIREAGVLQGILVAVDGPKGGGKTTVLTEVARLLRAEGMAVLLTKEPTPRFRLSNEQAYVGLELARLLLADRAAHVQEDILPALAERDMVIVDRYIASSLVFQVLDGVPFETVWAMNSSFPLPCLNLFLMADKATLRRRRQARHNMTRLEGSDLAAELQLYLRAQSHLQALGVDTAVIDNSDGTDLSQVAAAVAQAILSALEASRA